MILGKGDMVGTDVCIQMSQIDAIVKSSCDVRALTYCDLKAIHIPGIVETMKLYPEFQEEFCNDIIHDLTYNIREGYEAEVSHSYTRNSRNYEVIPRVSRRVLQ